MVLYSWGGEGGSRGSGFWVFLESLISLVMIGYSGFLFLSYSVLDDYVIPRNCPFLLGWQICMRINVYSNPLFLLNINTVSCHFSSFIFNTHFSPSFFLVSLAKVLSNFVYFFKEIGFTFIDLLDYLLGFCFIYFYTSFYCLLTFTGLWIFFYFFFFWSFLKVLKMRHKVVCFLGGGPLSSFLAWTCIPTFYLLKTLLCPKHSERLCPHQYLQSIFWFLLWFCH